MLRLHRFCQEMKRIARGFGCSWNAVKPYSGGAGCEWWRNGGCWRRTRESRWASRCRRVVSCGSASARTGRRSRARRSACVSRRRWRTCSCTSARAPDEGLADNRKPLGRAPRPGDAGGGAQRTVHVVRGAPGAAVAGLLAVPGADQVQARERDSLGVAEAAAVASGDVPTMAWTDIQVEQLTRLQLTCITTTSKACSKRAAKQNCQGTR